MAASAYCMEVNVLPVMAASAYCMEVNVLPVMAASAYCMEVNVLPGLCMCTCMCVCVCVCVCECVYARGMLQYLHVDVCSKHTSGSKNSTTNYPTQRFSSLLHLCRKKEKNVVTQGGNEYLPLNQSNCSQAITMLGKHLERTAPRPQFSVPWHWEVITYCPAAYCVLYAVSQWPVLESSFSKYHRPSLHFGSPLHLRNPGQVCLHMRISVSHNAQATTMQSIAALQHCSILFLVIPHNTFVSPM